MVELLIDYAIIQDEGKAFVIFKTNKDYECFHHNFTTFDGCKYVTFDGLPGYELGTIH